MKLVDIEALFNKAVELEAVALEQVGKYEPSENPREWHRWTGILQERTAFKYDLMDAPTIGGQIIRHGHWEKITGYYRCSECNQAFPDIGYGFNFCPECGADMREALE